MLVPLDATCQAAVSAEQARMLDTTGTDHPDEPIGPYLATMLDAVRARVQVRIDDLIQQVAQIDVFARQQGHVVWARQHPLPGGRIPNSGINSPGMAFDLSPGVSF